MDVDIQNQKLEGELAMLAGIIQMAPSDSYRTAGLGCHLQENNTSEKKKKRGLEIVFSIPRFQVLRLFKVNMAFYREFLPCHWNA